MARCYIILTFFSTHCVILRESDDRRISHRPREILRFTQNDTKNNMILIAHNIRSLHNVGAFFRTADAFGIEKIYLTGYTGCPPRKEIAKTALGSEHRILWEHRDELEPLMVELKEKGIQIVALEISDRSIPVDRLDTPLDKIALIVGSEVEGISKETLAECDQIVEIPMIGIKKSLNVSVATGIALFAITRKK